MIGHLTRRFVQTATLGAALFMSGSVLAQDETSGVLTKNLRAVETISGIGDELKSVISAELGFSPDHVQQWRRAVEAAFDPDLVEAEFVAALDARLAEPTRAAALAHVTSPLGQDVFDLVANAPDSKDDRAYLDEAQAYLDTTSAKRHALHEALFEAETGAERDSVVMDVYFRAMRIGATPILGAEVAEQWVASAEYLREEYAADHSLASVALYRQLPEDRHEALVEVLTSPEMIDYAAQSTAAFAETLHAAADRLAAEFASELGQ